MIVDEACGRRVAEDAGFARGSESESCRRRETDRCRFKIGTESRLIEVRLSRGSGRRGCRFCSVRTGVAVSWS